MMFASLVVVAVIVWWVHQFFVLRKAHSTFENYYAFRGCAQPLVKTDEYGTCKTNSGESIKMVKYQDRWYLDNDLPTCIFGVCF